MNPALSFRRPIVSARSANSGPKLLLPRRKRADRFVEHVGHAAARRAEREGRELRGHLGVEALDDADDRIIRFVDSRGLKCATCGRPTDQIRALQDDLAENEIRQHLRKRNVLRPRRRRGQWKTEDRRADQAEHSRRSL